MEPDDTDTKAVTPFGPKPGRPRLSPVPDCRMVCDPPETLSETEKQIWRDIVQRVRPGWFYSSEAMLSAYVSTLAQLEALGRGLSAEVPCSERWCQILRLQLATIKTVAMLATRLRLTPRSTVDRYTPKIISNRPRPWEIQPDDEPDEVS